MPVLRHSLCGTIFALPGTPAAESENSSISLRICVKKEYRHGTSQERRGMGES